MATAAGKVELAAPSGDYGNLVVVDHGFGLVTRYGHLSKFAVWQGATVKRGDVVGYVGATGRATGPHLHYEVLANGKLINPLQLLTGKAPEATNLQADIVPSRASALFCCRPQSPRQPRRSTYV